MNCGLCGKPSVWVYTLVYRSPELEVASALQGTTPELACWSCWHAETGKMDKEDLLTTLGDALTDISRLMDKAAALEQERDELRAEREGLLFTKQAFDKGCEGSYDQGYEDGFSSGVESVNKPLSKPEVCVPAVQGEVRRNGKK